MPHLLIIMLIISVLVIAFIELPRLLKEKKIREILVFCVLLSAGFTHALIQTMGIEVSSNVEVTFKIVGLIKEWIGLLIQ
ncbi:MAG: hypothetical protein APF76_03265 [Desulfitibacter sp. BRH_c19]|nr:MAG: hypothetical protein APF76_03265 [Desulfitibacter sp. BRH_c19]